MHLECRLPFGNCHEFVETNSEDVLANCFEIQPAQMNEELYRVQVVKFEEHKISDVGSVMKEFPPFRLDETNQCLWRSGEVADERILLTPKAFAVLGFLIERAGRLVTQDELLDKVWPDTHVQPEVLKSHIAKIRRVLGDDPKRPRFIETTQRRGYRFIAPISETLVESLRTAPRSNGKFVGREGVLSELSEALQRTLWNQRQIIFVTGEAGIGKTALVNQFKGQAAADVPGIQIAFGQCIEGYGGKEAYYPMLEALGGCAVLLEGTPSFSYWRTRLPHGWHNFQH